MILNHLFLFILFNYLNIISGDISFKDEYPGEIICQSGNLQDLSLHGSETRRKDITTLVKSNCTHLQGSLFIRGLKGSPGEEIILDTLKQIDGYLVIDENDVEVISFKRLKVIRGYVFKTLIMNKSSKVMNISLQVTNNPSLKTLDLSSLRSIANHDVFFNNNPLLTYLPQRIKWNELFIKSNGQSLRVHEITQATLSQDPCHSFCAIWPNMNNSFCWGPLKSQCQEKTLCESFAGECESCIYKNGKETNCCDPICIGGCRGFGPENCIACKQMLDGKKCVESCPSRFTGGIAGTTLNKAFKYYSGSFCSKKCQENMLPEDSSCVYSCTEGYFKNKTNHCEKCYGDICKKDLPCKMMAMLSGDHRDLTLNKNVLLQLTNCTKIVGYFMINRHTFNTNNVTVQMLYDHLSNLEELEGGFNYFMDDHLTNLTFLSKLKIFRASNLHVQMSGVPSLNKFTISSTKLRFLGLKSLKKIIGPFLMSKNELLCYVNLPWNEMIVGKYQIGKTNCKSDTCDKQCSSKGCWMSGDKWCYECTDFDANGQCVSNCSTIPGFFLSNSSNTNGPCDKCDKECAHTCSGSSPKDCIGGCIHKEEKKVCVRNCSLTSYEEKGTNKCLPCNNDCTSVIGLAQCSGPSNVPGPGGCNKCRYILIMRTKFTEKIINCVSQCPLQTFARASKNESIIKYFPDMGFVCESCHMLCPKCLGRKTHKEDCQHCTGFWNRENCVAKCPEAYSFGHNPKKKCLRCNNTCLDGCSGPKSSDCKKCKDRKIVVNETKFYCAKSCPEHKSVEEIDIITGEIICFALWESAAKKEEIKRTRVVIIAVLIILLIIIVVIILVVVFLRRKSNTDRLESELKARYSNLTEPNSKSENAFAQPPNMGRLAIISIEDLVFEDEARPLGFGAFGYVYKGKWKIPKEENMIIKKSTGEFYLPVAIKVIKSIGPSENEAIMQEAKIMASVSHMHCLRFIGVCLSYEKPCIVTAFVKEGSLDKYLVRNRGKITSLIMLSWAEQIADGMLYLTKRGIIHRDLAARNVLVNHLECVQITDFGLSKMLENTKEREIVIKSGKVPIRWLAIETLLEGRYSYETDVWAYGVTLWEIFTFAKVPYADQATLDISDFVMKGGRLSQPDICSLDVYIVMVNCWLESPNLRPDFEALMKTFIDYCKNPGRYLSIQGDPFEIPSPSNIEMTNFSNPYNDHFNFVPGTAETMLPLLNNRDSIDRCLNDSSLDQDYLAQGDDESRDILAQSGPEDLPTRCSVKTSNLFKRFHEKSQPSATPNNVNTNSRLVPLASLEEPTFRASSVDEDPRYVTDPTDKTIKLRQNPLNLRTQMSETPRFHSNPNVKKHADLAYNLPPPPKAPDLTNDTDGYLEPIRSPNNTHAPTFSNYDDYLEPVSMKNKISIDQDEYMTPSYNNTPRESLIKTNNSNKIPNSARESTKLPLMKEEQRQENSYFPENTMDDEYLEPQPKTPLIKYTSL